MANNAPDQQIPSMVRRPKAVWPGLDRMDLQRKLIAGDGNCLFASLADQLYGSPAKHDEIRAAVIQHMRALRPLFENVAIKDDIQQKRATRAQTHALRKGPNDDPFEEYLAIMSRLGTYGGEPELVAFVQCFDQDVLIHLPRMPGYPEAIPYTNQHRPVGAVVKPVLHLCYGGDETANAHYDSVRRNKPVVPVLTRPDQTVPDLSPTSSTSSAAKSLTSRAIRNSRSDITKDMMHELVVRGTTDLKYALEHLHGTDRARSPSVSSSHNSNSSKRSLEEEGETTRTTKRADRRKSIRRRPRADVPLHGRPSTNLAVRLTTGLATPTSTQDSESSSEQSDPDSEGDKIQLRTRRQPGSRALTPDVVSHVVEHPRRSATALTPTVVADAPHDAVVPGGPTGTAPRAPTARTAEQGS